jgi:hypothetical protein
MLFDTPFLDTADRNEPEALARIFHAFIFLSL